MALKQLQDHIYMLSINKMRETPDSKQALWESAYWTLHIKLKNIEHNMDSTIDRKPFTKKLQGMDTFDLAKFAQQIK